MKSTNTTTTTALLLGIACAAAAATATNAFAELDNKLNTKAALFTIEVAPGETRQITEEERWELSLNGGCGAHFFDITTSHASPLALRRLAPYPPTFTHTAAISLLTPQLSGANVRAHLETYSTFHTRFSETQTGVQAATWLQTQVEAVVAGANKPGVTTTAFPHKDWPQQSIIVRIPGRSTRTVVVGAHLDSVNSADRLAGRAPGVDDNGTGSFTILEALRVLLSDAAFAPENLENTVEFHWYAAEEGGLRGSQDVFTQYAAAGREVWAMLNQDMTGYSKGVLDAGLPESFGLITDFTDAPLNEFVARVITQYTDIAFAESTCGYACSDHGSAMRSGYPASFVFEAPFQYRNPYIHTVNDTIEHIDFKHVVQHAKLVVGFVYELGFSKAADNSTSPA